MKIIMVHPHDLYAKEEPWTTRIKNIAAQLAAQGNEVKIVYFPLKYRSGQKSVFLNDIEFIPLSRRVGVIPFLRNIDFFIRKCKWADIVHFQKCFYHAAIPALIGAFVNNKPVHYDWDDWEIKIFRASARQPFLASLFLGTLERIIPGLCDTVSVSSQRLKQECLKCGVKEERIFMAAVGADLKLFNPNISGIRIRERYNIDNHLVTYLGQLHGCQYVEQFIKAAKIVSNYIIKIHFMIVGDGYRQYELKKMVADYALSDKFIFTGAVAHKEVPLYIAASDVTVACFEDNDITKCKSPLKIAEYMASGKAIVASNVGEVKSMLGGAGILTNPSDAESLSKGIWKMLEDNPLRECFEKKARQRAEEIYNWQFTASQMLKAYSIACSCKKE